MPSNPCRRNWLDNSPEQPPGPATPDRDFTTVDLKELYSAYEENEAAADVKYLNKRVQFVFVPGGIDRDSSGVYYAWSNIFGLTDPVQYGQHTKCYFCADQTAGLANFKPGQSMSIRGVCTGKTGMINFYYAPAFNNGSKGFYKASPAIAFKDCKQVE